MAEVGTRDPTQLNWDVLVVCSRICNAASGGIFHSHTLDNTRTSSKELSHLAALTSLELYCSCRARTIPSTSLSRSMMS